MSMNLRDIAILNIKRADYCCIISKFNKSEAINLMQNIYWMYVLIEDDVLLEKYNIILIKSALI